MLRFKTGSETFSNFNAKLLDKVYKSTKGGKNIWTNLLLGR